MLALFDARGAGPALQVGDQNCGTTTGVQHQWARHPTRPLPFFVIDHLSDDETLKWIRHEIGSEATLQEFSAKPLTLFGDKLRGREPQKSACLKLYTPGPTQTAGLEEGVRPTTARPRALRKGVELLRPQPLPRLQQGAAPARLVLQRQVSRRQRHLQLHGLHPQAEVVRLLQHENRPRGREQARHGVAR